MSNLTKKPKRPVLSQLTKTFVAGAVVVAGCGDEIGVPVFDAAPADVMQDTGSPDAPFVGVPAMDAGPDDAASSVDVTGVDAPAPGVPAADSGPDAPPPGLMAFDAGD